GSQLFPLKLLFFLGLSRSALSFSKSTGAGFAHTFDGDRPDVDQVRSGNRDSLAVREGRPSAASVSDTTAAANAQTERRSSTDFDSFGRSSLQISRGLFTRSSSTQLYNRKPVEGFLVYVAALSLYVRSMQMGLPRQ